MITLDRNLAGNHRIQHALSGILEAAFVDDTARCRVNHPAGDMQPVDRGRPEGEIDQRMRRLGGVATLPVGLADPVAEFQAALGAVQAGAADEGAALGQRERRRSSRRSASPWSSTGMRGLRSRHKETACGPAFPRRAGCWPVAASSGMSSSCGGLSTSRSVTRTGQSMTRLSSSSTSFSATMTSSRHEKGEMAAHLP